MAPNNKQPDTKRTWNDALKAENCVQVRKLLWKPGGKLRPGAVELLKEGWKEVDLVQQSLKSKPASIWKGRTALHVAARRGDVELVKDILEIAYPLTSGASTASKEHGRKDSDPLKSEASMASKEQDPKESDPPVLGASISSDPLISKLLVSMERLTNVYNTTVGTSVASKEQVGLRSTDLNPLLEVKDDDYELDALGMAVVNGNEDIVKLLKSASLRCEWNPYDISHDVVGDIGVSDEDNKVLGGALSDVTNKVLRDISQSKTVYKDEQGRISTRAEKDKNIGNIIQLYKEDCDFNFIHEDVDVELDKLDMHLFFHFSFSTWTMPNVIMLDLMEDIQKEIISRANNDDELLEYALKDGQGRTEEIRKEITSRVRKNEKLLLQYLLVTLKDGQGRTALHVAVDSDRVDSFLYTIKSLGDGEETKKYLNVRDSANRTPLYRAAAKKHSVAVKELLEDRRTDVHAKIEYSAYRWGRDLDIDKLSWENGFKSDCVYVPQEKLSRKSFNNKGNSQGGPGPNIKRVEQISSTALHVAIIHKHEIIVKKILEAILKQLANYGHLNCPSDCKSDHFANRSPGCSRRYTWPILTASQGDEASYQRPELVTTTQLTVLVGSIPILQQLLEAEEKWKKPAYFSGVKETTFPNFLLAAAMGNPGVIKAFLDSKQGNFDYDIRDSFHNTALHHALKGKHVPFHPHIVDFVGCHHVYSSRWDNDVWISHWLANPEEKPQVQRDVGNDVEYRYGQRRGSINLLLEAGINIWAPNTHRRTASPDPDAPKDFVEWWYDKVATETKQEQTKLTDAANAISVTAALVATASYLGPLQPPLGYDEGSMQVNVLAVRIFVVCNNLSFYFALAAIMWALLPSLPLQKESMFRELKQTRILVAFAVTCLFPSIICVLVAFAAGYIAVIPDHGLSHHGLTVATMVVGGCVCLFVIVWFFKRLWKVLKDRLKEPLLDLFRNVLKDRSKGPIFQSLNCLKDKLEGPSFPVLQNKGNAPPVAVDVN